MPPKKSHKKRQNWNPEDMAAAVLAVREKKMGYLKASINFKVPRTTLFRLVAEKDTPTEQLVRKNIGRKPVFNKHFESLLVEYALEMESKFYGLTQMDLRRLAYQLALRNNISNPFTSNAAGRYWLKGFLSRNKNILSMRKPTGTSFARALGFTKERMDEFYDLLEHIYETKKFTPDRIFNVDETGMSIVQSKYPKIIARRGKKQIGAMTSAERGSLLTVVACMSPAGIFVPPMIIFPRKNMTDILMRGAPLGSIGRAHPSGWIQTNLFTEWFQHFIEYTKPSEKSPVLLIFDGHYSHTKNIDIVDMARDNHVTLLSLPPHCTHKVQPLDRSFMGPLKSYYSEEVRIWLRENNKPLTAYDIVELFGKAYRKCQTGEIAANGFKIGGIYPFNRHAFSEADYLAAEQEEQLQNDTVQQLNQSDVISADEAESSVNEGDLKSCIEAEPNVEQSAQQGIPGPSSESVPTELEVQQLACGSGLFVTPSDILPVPLPKKRNSNRGRKATKSTIISSSPYKRELEEAAKKKSPNKIVKLTLNKTIKNVEKVGKSGKRKRKQKSEDIETDSESNTSLNISNSSEELAPEFHLNRKPEEQDTVCFFCDGKFSEDARGEQWVQCLTCESWVHCDCAGYDAGTYVCDYCK